MSHLNAWKNFSGSVREADVMRPKHLETLGILLFLLETTVDKKFWKA